MKYRVSLTDREIQYIITGLTHLKNESSLNWEVVNTGRRAYQDIIDRLMKALPASKQPVIKEPK